MDWHCIYLSNELSDCLVCLAVSRARRHAQLDMLVGHSDDSLAVGRGTGFDDAGEVEQTAGLDGLLDGLFAAGDGSNEAKR